MDGALFGRVLLAVGVLLVVAGLFYMLGGRLPFGRLPGDIALSGQGGGFFFPIVSCIVISVVLTVLLNIVIRR